MKSAFQILKERDLVSRRGLNLSALTSLSTTKIFGIAESIVNEAEVTERPLQRSLFSHSASSSLAGGREDCIRLECRVSRLNELARFALMYSDRVYVRNYFADYGHLKGRTKEESIRQRFHDDVFLVALLGPLLKAGIVELFNPQNHVCPGCWAGMSYGPDAYRRLFKEEARLSKEYFESTRMDLEPCDDPEERYHLNCEGPEHLFEHRGVAWIFNEIPKELRTDRILRKIGRGERAFLSEKMRKQFGYHKFFAQQVISNISFELAASQLLGTSYLTNKTLHISFLNSISNNPEIDKRNLIASKYLTSIVPFVEDVNWRNLIKLRKREEESFIQYRRALNEAIAGFTQGGAAFSEKDARALYSDVIAPRLTSLERKVRVAKRDLVTGGSRSIIAVAGAITFGIYTGFIPTEIAEMAKLVGFTKVGADIFEKVLAVGDAERAVEGDDLYFLWKVKKLTR